MSRHVNHGRRFFVRTVIGTAAVAPIILTTGCQSEGSTDRNLHLVSLDEALAEAMRLASATLPATDSMWTLPQTLVHCAQSIEYSITGFPIPRSKLFQRTVGATAFNVFAWRGRMTHDLTEAIPGAPTLDNENSVEAAIVRLQKAVDAFRLAKEPLQPHFAYGTLNKEDYELAHAMHLANHFSAIDA